VGLGNCNTRYPGGAVANYHDFRVGYFLKYYPVGYDIDPYFKRFKDEWYDPYSTFWTDKPYNTLDNFKAIYMRMGCFPLFDLNLLTSEYRYQEAMLYHAEEINIPVRYIELGSEFYNEQINLRKKFPTVVDYAKTAVNWATQLKANTAFHIPGNPDKYLKIAAIGAESDPNDGGRQRLWLDGLLESFSSNPNAANIDAVTMHIYSGAPSSDFKDVCHADDQALPSYAQNFSIYYPTPSSIPDCMLRIMLNSPFRVMDDLLTPNPNEPATTGELAKIAAAGKETWITEYQMNDYGPYYVHGTWAQGLYAASMTLNWLRDANITKINMHTAVGDALASMVFTGVDDFNFSGPTPPPTLPITVPWDLTAMGNAMSMVGPALMHGMDVAPLDFSSMPGIGVINPNYTGLTHLELFGYQVHKDLTDEAIILNLSPDAYTIHINDVLPNATYNNLGYEIMEGDPFYHVFKNATLGSVVTNNMVGSGQLIRTGFQTATYTDGIDIPGYSILRIKGVRCNSGPCTDLMLVASDKVICGKPDINQTSPCSFSNSVTSVIASGGVPPYYFPPNINNISYTIDPDYTNIAYIELSDFNGYSSAPYTTTLWVQDAMGNMASTEIQ